MGITTAVVDEANISEADAIYNLRVEIVEYGTLSEDGEMFKTDPRVNEEKCGIEQINFSQFDSPYIYLSDNLAPYHISFKHIINQFGTHNKEGLDELVLYVYSDYLGQGVRFPVFEMVNNEMLYFEDINIPCESEIVVSLQNEMRALEKIHAQNSIRIPCNMATLGTTQKLFRHYEIKLFQEEDPEP